VARAVPDRRSKACGHRSGHPAPLVRPPSPVGPWRSAPGIGRPGDHEPSGQMSTREEVRCPRFCPASSPSLADPVRSRGWTGPRYLHAGPRACVYDPATHPENNLKSSTERTGLLAPGQPHRHAWGRGPADPVSTEIGISSPASISGVRSGSSMSRARACGVLRAVVRRPGLAGVAWGGRRRRIGWAGG